MNMKRIAIYGVIGILILMFYILYCPKASSMDGKVDTLVVSHFTKETSLEKEFSNKENSIEGIGFRFETYGNKKNKGHLNFKILDEDKTIYETSIPISKISNDEIYTVPLKPSLLSPNKKYKIKLAVEQLDEQTTLGIYGFIKSQTDKSLKYDIGVYYEYRQHTMMLLIYMPIYLIIVCLIEIFRKRSRA